MKKLIRKLDRVRVTHSTDYSMLQTEPFDSLSEHTKQRSNVPHGHFPVYVGIDDQMMSRRFIVNAEMLRHPIFVDLLHRSAQEYGYEQRGVLKIPIDVVVFERVLESLRQGQEPLNLCQLI